MKETRTRRIDGEVIARAKAFAKRERTSLSQLVEKQFKSLGSESFADKWYGKFKAPAPNAKDPRLTYLLKKYVDNR